MFPARDRRRCEAVGAVRHRDDLHHRPPGGGAGRRRGGDGHVGQHGSGGGEADPHSGLQGLPGDAPGTSSNCYSLHLALLFSVCVCK